MPPRQIRPKERENIKRRFQTNMRRISGLVSFLNAPSSGLEPPVGFQSEGVRADIYRSVVVYLHAAIEDFIRNILHLKDGFTFGSKSDLRGGLHHRGLDIAIFEDLFTPMEQLARRRQRIVHFADLDGVSPSPWGVTDLWRLIHWNLATLVLYYRLLKSRARLSIVEETANQNAERVLVQNIEFGNALVSLGRSLGLGRSPPEREIQIQAATEAIRLGEEMVNRLKLTVDMFLNQEGSPM